ncbi:FAD-dependent oxidoreductase [Natrialbaceae archaeon A-CW1-1]
MNESERTSDLIVVGSGVGGLAAAATATSNGKSVTILEKGSVLGGSSGLSGAQLWIPGNEHMKEIGHEDSIEAAVEYLTHLAGELHADEGAARRYVERAPEAVAYFEKEIGLEIQCIHGMPDYHSDGPGGREEGRYLEPKPIDRDSIPVELPDSPHLPGGATNDELLTWGGAFTAQDWDWEIINRRREEGIATMGTALIGYFLRAALKNGADIRTEIPVTSLIVEDGQVIGVEIETESSDGHPETIRANLGVVLNTGAYDWNPDLIESFESTPAEHVASAAVPTATGDGHRMAALEGAKLGVYPPVGSAKGFFVAVPNREFLEAPLYRYCYNVGLPHAIAVTSAGERFCDESFYPKQAAALYDPTGEYPHFPPYMIFDEQYHRQYPLGSTLPGDPYDDTFLEAKASDLETLADRLGMDNETLVRTVDRFNEHARQGEDPDFGRGENAWGHVWGGDPGHEPNPNLGPITEPPFYAVRLYIGLSSMGNVGLVTDPDARVLDWSDEAIDGLYAVGSVCAPVEWGIGYQSGLQNGRSMTDGYLAAKHVLESSR